MRFQNAHLRVYDACSMTTPARTHVLTYIHMQPPGFALKLSPEVTRWRCESLWVPYRSLQVTAPPHASCIKTQVSTCTRHGVQYRSYLLRQVPRSASTSRTRPPSRRICHLWYCMYSILTRRNGAERGSGSVSEAVMRVRSVVRDAATRRHAAS